MRKLAILLPIILLAGLFQNTGVFNIFGVKPNLLLAVLIPAIFFLDQILAVAAALAIALLVSDFRAGFAGESVVLALLILIVPVFGRRLPWNPFINNMVLVGAATIVFYLLTGPAYIVSSPLGVLGEIFYNSLFAAIFYNLFNSCLKMNSMLKI
ncbi:MAG: hypothetical protein G01um101419_349 [Parcubacteria group bacterium Gr01-1014_19]|nr:MAG: hypothetical protein G01um101419_349 [Parcubacteria group bacterium Gr01-1014_19]